MPIYSKSDQAILSLFGRKLKEQRLKKGLSQEKLAELADLHRTYAASAERGERNVSLLNLKRLANALEIDLCDLIE